MRFGMNNFEKMLELKSIADDLLQMIGLKEFAKWCKENRLKAVQSNMDRFLEADSIDVEKIARRYFWPRQGVRVKKS